MTKVPAKKSEITHPNAAAFPAGVSGPALRALSHAGIRTMAQLAQRTESDVAKLHGVGPKALRTLRLALAREKRRFRSE